MSKGYKQQKIEKTNEVINKILLWPIAVMLTLVPLIVRLNMIIPDKAVQNVFRQPQFADFFAQGKAVILIIISVIMCIMLFFLFDKTKIKKDKYIVFYSICASIFLLFTVLSTVFSEHKSVALWGVPDRAEGMVVYLCYLFIMIYIFYSFNKPEHYKYIVIPLGIVTIVLTILGLSQWIGKDLMLHTEIGRSLIVPEKYAQLRDALGTKIANKTAYGTFSNPNYMGSFVALVLPIFMTLALFVKDWKKQVVFALLAFCNLFLLVASGSRAGMIGCALTILVAVILISRRAIEKWFVTVPIVLVGIVILFGVNQVSGGKLANQIQKLTADIVAVITPADKTKDYKDTLPIREIRSEEDKIVIVTQEDTLTVTLVEGKIEFYDQKDKRVRYEETEAAYNPIDERFLNIRFIKIFSDDANTSVGGITLQIAGGNLALFKIDPIQGVYPIDSYNQEKINIMEAPAIGFKGKEKVGSGRGYIWSKSIPILIDSFIIGKGPDAYPMHFPQNDYLAKYYALYATGIVVDKPHNMYLQMGINHSVIALITFLILIVGYIVQSIKLYSWKKSYSPIELKGAATVLGVVGYLAAGLFNDSVVSIAFIFWILLGVGIGINYLVSHQIAQEIKS